MKTLVLLSLFVTGSSFAQTHTLDSRSVSVVNDIVGAIHANNKAAKTFVQRAKFDHISVTYSADHRDSIITASGMYIVGFDMACGSLGLVIKRSFKRSPMGFGMHAEYESFLDKSKLSNLSFCQLGE